MPNGFGSWWSASSRAASSPGVKQHDVVALKPERCTLLIIRNDDDRTCCRLACPDLERIRPAAGLDRAILAACAVVRRAEPPVPGSRARKVSAGVVLLCSIVQTAAPAVAGARGVPARLRSLSWPVVRPSNGESLKTDGQLRDCHEIVTRLSRPRSYTITDVAPRTR